MSKIEITNVSKAFGDVKALDNVSLTFEEGTIYGLLGRNGAGKSTLLSVITNRIFADSGEVRLDGEIATENDIAQGQMYLMNEKDYYVKEHRVSEIFRWSNEFYGCFDMERALALAKDFGLDVKKRIGKLSTGYKSIFKNIIALSLDVPFVLLDEPVLGLDANHRELFYKKLIELYSENPRSFIISTHLIEEVSKIVEKVVIIKEGRIVKDTTTEELLSAGYTVTGLKKDVDAFISDKKLLGTDELGGIKTAYIEGELKGITVPETLEIGKADLQKMFIELTNS